ncbi:MAG: DNA-formamidopyrimidine glycosylase family protein [Armatimonadota bacterium]|nr:DNA-formamidopyrimidine glycosylase family protein [Armatimonadota bacterium]MDR7533421.1 DNA-formamidopyrimidine glycosylase family protein [Armatimonadota bacterium]
MPELPEVETARRTLAPQILGRRIESVAVHRPPALRTHRPAEAARLLRGRIFRDVQRRGKALLLHLDEGWTLVFHYALWGVVVVRPGPVGDAMTAVVVGLDDGRVIEFRELQLSSLHLVPTARLDGVSFLAALGADPLDRSLTYPRFRELLAGRGSVRGLLTDQRRLAGIGNLWVQEILFAAGLRPTRAAATLDEAAWRRLYRAMRTVLGRAVRAGGEPEFLDATGRTGRARLYVYGRGGQPCRVCGARIVASRAGGRPAFWCPRCQR